MPGGGGGRLITFLTQGEKWVICKFVYRYYNYNSTDSLDRVFLSNIFFIVFLFRIMKLP